MVKNMKNKLLFQFDSRIRRRGYRDLEKLLIDFVDGSKLIPLDEYTETYENSISDIEVELGIDVSEIREIKDLSMLAFFDVIENVYYFYDIIYMRKFTFGLERLRT